MCSNWYMSEDVQLCISYCRQSVDPISGSRQKVNKLWEKIHLDFHDGWLLGGNQPRAEARSQAALASCFAKLKPMLVYWGSCLSYAERNRESGCNMQDEEVGGIYKDHANEYRNNDSNIKEILFKEEDCYCPPI
ncbi:hypothetical protein QQ045_014459 [Rhodiola kirilowii]